MSNKQLDAWTSEFGDDYIDRNPIDDKNIQFRMQFWAQIIGNLPIQPLNEPKKILEIGSSVGANLVAVDNLYKLHNKDIELCAVEPNTKAKKILKQQEIRKLQIIDGDACNISCANSYADIVFTCGVLIHVSPDDLQKAMNEMYRVSKKYIIIAEYFSPEPREIRYRGEDGLLFTRDFGSSFIDNFPGLRCLSYAFAWKRYTGMDNLTWWAFEKVN